MLKHYLFQFFFRGQVLRLLLVLQMFRQLVNKGHGGRKDERLTQFSLLLVRVDHLHQVLQLLKVTLLHHTVSLVDR